MSLEKAVEWIGSLLIPQTYTDLQRVEEELCEQGIDIVDDFVMTKRRRTVLGNVENQFASVVAPTMILTGWYGSGKTALLSRIVKDMNDGKLLYGKRQLDTILIQLNVQNTLSLFLHQILASLEELKGTEWVLGQYRRSRSLIGLPDVSPTDVRHLVETLVQMPPAQMPEVAQFLDELFEQYKRSTEGKCVLALVIDELENLTDRAKLEGIAQLVELLKILIDNAVREYIDQLSVTRDPRVIIIFSIISRRALAETKWFPQDTLERMRRVEQDANLSPQTAEYLMKEILRIYFTSVVNSLCQKSADARLREWSKRLQSAPGINDADYTYPITPEVHRFFVSRLLLASPPDGQVRTFRAYQVGVRALLLAWQGEGPVDLRFMIDRYEELAGELGQYPDGVILSNLIGEEHVRSLVERRFSQLRSGLKYQLGTVTQMAITRGTTPVVSIAGKNLEQWLPAEKIPTEAAFRELLDSVKGVDLDDWSVTGDMIYVNVHSIVAQLSEHVETVSIGERAEQLVRETRSERTQRSLTEVLCESLDSEAETRASCDENEIIHVTDTSIRGQLIGITFLGFNVDTDDIRRLIDERTALCPGIVFNEAETDAEGGFPFEVTVLLPTPLRNRGDFYASRIITRFQQWWDDAFSPLISAIVRLEQRSYYDAFKEALNAILLVRGYPPDQRGAFKEFDRNLKQIILELDLTPTDTERWISAKLHFARFHDIEPTRRLIKVLSWQGTAEESVLYKSSDDVKPQLHSRLDTNLPIPEDWKREVLEHWEDEDFISDGKLVPSSNWAEPRRRLHNKVNDQLRDKPLSFQGVGKLVFGETRIDNSRKAQVALHLFLKLGKVSPWNWTLTDDQHDYRGIEVRSGALRQKQLAAQVSQGLELKLQRLVLASYFAAAKKHNKSLKDIRRLLQMRDLLGDHPPVPTLQEWAEEIGEITPEMPRKHLVEKALVRECPPNLSKVAEFLDKLGRLVQAKSSLAYIVSQVLPGFIEQVSIDLECERLLRRIGQLYKNWDRELPFTWEDRFLVRLHREYTSGLGDIPNWERQKATQFDKQFANKVSSLSEDGLEEALETICTWLDLRAEEIVNPKWEATYCENDRAQWEQFLKDALGQASQEISSLRDQLDEELSVLNDLEQNPLLTPYSQEIREHRLKLGQSDTSLSLAEDRLEETQFGPMMGQIRGHLDQWGQLKVEILQSQSTMVDTWLQQHPHIVQFKNPILESLTSATMPLNRITQQMMESGKDPVQQLLEGEVEDILALFAAAQMLDALGKREGEQ